MRENKVKKQQEKWSRKMIVSLSLVTVFFVSLGFLFFQRVGVIDSLSQSFYEYIDRDQLIFNINRQQGIVAGENTGSFYYKFLQDSYNKSTTFEQRKNAFIQDNGVYTDGYPGQSLFAWLENNDPRISEGVEFLLNTFNSATAEASAAAIRAMEHPNIPTDQKKNIYDKYVGTIQDINTLFQQETNPNASVQKAAGVYAFLENYPSENTNVKYNYNTGGQGWRDFSFDGRSYTHGGTYDLHQLLEDYLQWRFDWYVKSNDFSSNEFDSRNYMWTHMNAVLIVYDFTKNQTVKNKAKMVADFLLLDSGMDFSANQYGGAYGSRDRDKSGVLYSKTGNHDYNCMFLGKGCVAPAPYKPHYNSYLTTYRVPEVVFDVANIDDEDDSYWYEHREYNANANRVDKGKITFVSKYFNLGGGYRYNWMLNLKSEDLYRDGIIHMAVPFRILTSSEAIHEDVEDYPDGLNNYFFQYRNVVFSNRGGENLHVFTRSSQDNYLARLANFDKYIKEGDSYYMQEGKAMVALQITADSMFLEVQVVGVNFNSLEEFKTAFENRGTMNTTQGEHLSINNSEEIFVDGVRPYEYPFDRLETIDITGNKIIDWDFSSHKMTVSKHSKTCVYDFDKWQTAGDCDSVPGIDPDTCLGQGGDVCTADEQCTGTTSVTKDEASCCLGSCVPKNDCGDGVCDASKSENPHTCFADCKPTGDTDDIKIDDSAANPSMVVDKLGNLHVFYDCGCDSIKNDANRLKPRVPQPSCKGVCYAQVKGDKSGIKVEVKNNKNNFLMMGLDTRSVIGSDNVMHVVSTEEYVVVQPDGSKKRLSFPYAITNPRIAIKNNNEAYILYNYNLDEVHLKKIKWNGNSAVEVFDRILNRIPATKPGDEKPEKSGNLDIDSKGVLHISWRSHAGANDASGQAVPRGIYYRMFDTNTDSLVGQEMVITGSVSDFSDLKIDVNDNVHFLIVTPYALDGLLHLVYKDGKKVSERKYYANDKRFYNSSKRDDGDVMGPAIEFNESTGEIYMTYTGAGEEKDLTRIRLKNFKGSQLKEFSVTDCPAGQQYNCSGHVGGNSSWPFCIISSPPTVECDRGDVKNDSNGTYDGYWCINKEGNENDYLECHAMYKMKAYYFKLDEAGNIVTDLTEFTERTPESNQGSKASNPLVAPSWNGGVFMVYQDDYENPNSRYAVYVKGFEGAMIGKPIIRSDFNCDGEVDIRDLGILLSNWMSADGSINEYQHANCDESKSINLNERDNSANKIDLLDIGELLSCWGFPEKQTCFQ